MGRPETVQSQDKIPGEYNEIKKNKDEIVCTKVTQLRQIDM